MEHFLIENTKQGKTCFVPHNVHEGRKDLPVKNVFDILFKQFPKKRNLETHIQMDHKCDKCGKEFSKKYLKAHIQNDGRKDYKCKECEKQFCLESNLKRHIQTVHEGRKDHKCNECGKGFPTKMYLKTHIQYVCGRNDHKCNKYGKQFSQENHLKMHIQTFQGHKCIQCRKVFSRKIYLKMHIQAVHEGRNDHKCKECGKQFSLHGTLREHIITVHEGRKDHKCNQCEKQFAREAALKRHVLCVHEGRNDHTKKILYQALISKELENNSESCRTNSVNSWAKKPNIQNECKRNENTTINSLSEKIKKMKIKEERIIILNEKPENSPASDDLNFLCENELDLDQIPIFGTKPTMCLII